MRKLNIEEFSFLDSLKKMNEKGYFDEYSDEHFLIKAMQGKMDYFNRYKHLVKNSTHFSTGEMNARTFIINFSNNIQWFCKHFTEKDMKKFIKDQLSAGKKNYNEEQFFRAMAEINVLNFLMNYGPNLENAIYEPKLGINGSNPEARLIYKDNIIIDVEVKTPGFNTQIEGNEKGVLIPTFLLDEKQKNSFKKQCEKRNFKFILPRVDKLKDYINDAGKKFEMPKSKNHINVLFINWTYTDIEKRGYLEPYSLLYNNLNGILKNKEMALKIGINEKALKKISAIVIYQDSFDSLIFGDFRYMWSGYNFRMLPNTLMDKELIDIDLISSTLRMNPPKRRDDILPYELRVEAGHLQEVFELTDFINRRVKGKIKGEDNFTYFNKGYYKRCMKKNRKKLERINMLKSMGIIH